MKYPRSTKKMATKLSTEFMANTDDSDAKSNLESSHELISSEDGSWYNKNTMEKKKHLDITPVSSTTPSSANIEIISVRSLRERENLCIYVIKHVLAFAAIVLILAILAIVLLKMFCPRERRPRI